MSYLKDKSFLGEKNIDSLEEARHLALLLTRTASAFKIFPPEHATVKHFLDELYEQLKNFLDKNGNFDLIIGENYFDYLGERIFEDEDVAHSLPFFFFKDGLLRLSFHRGITEKELWLFFETIKEVAFQPPEEADIVSALWEKNFENITFYAPDEFIIEKIAAGRHLPDYQVNLQELYSGKIELDEEDRQAIVQWSEKADSLDDLEKEKLAALEEIPTELKEDEWRMVETIIQSHRQLPQDEELARLLLEILYLEDRPDPLPAFKASLHETYKELLKNVKLSAATSFLHDLISLNKLFISSQPEKAKIIESFLVELGNEEYLGLFREIYLAHRDSLKKEDWLDFLMAIDSAALSYLAHLYRSFPGTPPSALEDIATPILEKWAEKNPEELMRLVQESQPHWTRLIIRALASKRGAQVIPFLAGFIRSTQPLLRREALQALSILNSPLAQKIILGYLSDQDEEIRIEAIKSLSVKDETILDYLLKQASPSRLKEKTEQEIKAIFEVLAKTVHPRVNNYFRELFQLSWFLKPKNKRICFLAIETLKKFSHAQNKQLLQEVKEKGRKQLRRYCAIVLNEIESQEKF